MRSSFSAIYRSTSTIIINTLLILFAVNIVIYFGLKAFPEGNGVKSNAAKENVWLAHHGYAKLEKFFPGLSREELNQFLNETWITEQNYAPFIEVQTSEAKSKYYNAHKVGFRLIPEQAPWPPSNDHYNVFVFGGSTTLGAGAADDGTIAAKLQTMLREKNTDKKVNVYNFGTGSHFSTQERIYLDQLVLNGYVPNLAIFVDGLNDFYFWQGEPVHSGWYRNVLQLIKDFNWRHDLAYHTLELLKKTPMGQLIARFQPKERVAAFWINHVPDAQAAEPSRIDGVINRYIRNIRAATALGQAYAFETLFVWQPVPFFNYPGEPELYRAFGDAVGEHRRSAFGYPAMQRFVANNDMGPRFVWCADVSKDISEILYVDHVHYNPRMAGLVADCIADAVEARKILPR